MKILKQLFRFYIEASLHVALSVACLIALTFYKFQIQFDFSLCLIGFFATVFSYNFMKFGTKEKFYLKASGCYMRVIQLLSFFCLIASCWIAFQLNYLVWAMLILTGILTVLYSLPLLPNQQSFRSLSGLKVYIVAICWALTTVLMPILDDKQSMNLSVWVEFWQRFFLVLALLIPFDIRDLNDDSINLGTIPQQLGVSKSKYVGYGFAALFLAFGLLFAEVTLTAVIADAVMTFLLFVAIYFAETERSKYYAGFLVESLPILWLLMYLVLG